MAQAKSKTPPKQRILETAERLFYAEGVRSVGIDRIIAEASVAKMTLYNHFPSKDDLILAVLQYREGQVGDFFESAIEHHVSAGTDRLSAFFAALRDWFETPGFRGCSFINAAVELADCRHPASQFAAAHKCRFREMIEEIVRETASRKATSVVPAIFMLVEGAIVTAVMEQSPDAADTARDAALQLVSEAGRK